MYKGKEDKVYSSFERLYMGLFGVESRQVPEVVGGVCCAQFVVSRDRIRQRGRKEYLRMREWAAGNEELDDRGVGAVFEMVWHVVFEEDSVL